MYKEPIFSPKKKVQRGTTHVLKTQNNLTNKKKKKKNQNQTIDAMYLDKC